MRQMIKGFDFLRMGFAGLQPVVLVSTVGTVDKSLEVGFCSLVLQGKIPENCKIFSWNAQCRYVCRQQQTSKCLKQQGTLSVLFNHINEFTAHAPSSFSSVGSGVENYGIEIERSHKEH